MFHTGPSDFDAHFPAKVTCILFAPFRRPTRFSIRIFRVIKVAKPGKSQRFHRISPIPRSLGEPLAVSPGLFNHLLTASAGK
jgi:hypothetical protein